MRRGKRASNQMSSWVILIYMCTDWAGCEEGGVLLLVNISLRAIVEEIMTWNVVFRAADAVRDGVVFDVELVSFDRPVRERWRFEHLRCVSVSRSVRCWCAK